MIGSVTCAWLDDYETARASHDQAGMTAVDEALSTSRQWKTLVRMNKDGYIPGTIWTLADRVSQRQDAGDYRTSLGCP